MFVGCEMLGTFWLDNSVSQICLIEAGCAYKYLWMRILIFLGAVEKEGVGHHRHRAYVLSSRVRDRRPPSSRGRLTPGRHHTGISIYQDTSVSPWDRDSMSSSSLPLDHRLGDHQWSPCFHHSSLIFPFGDQLINSILTTLLCYLVNFWHNIT
jgi:hypothetical protein